MPIDLPNLIAKAQMDPGWWSGLGSGGPMVGYTGPFPGQPSAQEFNYMESGPPGTALVAGAGMPLGLLFASGLKKIQPEFPLQKIQPDASLEKTQPTKTRVFPNSWQEQAKQLLDKGWDIGNPEYINDPRQSGYIAKKQLPDGTELIRTGVQINKKAPLDGETLLIKKPNGMTLSTNLDAYGNMKNLSLSAGFEDPFQYMKSGWINLHDDGSMSLNTDMIKKEFDITLLKKIGK